MCVWGGGGATFSEKQNLIKIGILTIYTDVINLYLISAKKIKGYT